MRAGAVAVKAENDVAAADELEAVLDMLDDASSAIVDLRLR